MPDFMRIKSHIANEIIHLETLFCFVMFVMVPHDQDQLHTYFSYSVWKCDRK